MSTVQLLRPVHGLDVGAPIRLSRRPVGRRGDHRAPIGAIAADNPRELGGQSFAASRLAHAIELGSACVVIAVFLAVALFV